MSISHPTSKRATTLLILGALGGFILAATGLLETSTSQNIDAVATVNDELISKEDYLAYLSLLAKDKRNPLSEEDRRHVLNRMIEEKLIIERGLDIGLAQSDPSVRKSITNSMIQTVTADAATQEADKETLRDFYQQNQAYFSRPPRLQLQRVIFRSADHDQALAKATQAHQRLAAGEDFQSIKQQLGSPEVLSIPNSLLPPNKIRQYIGPKLTEAALLMRSGTISEPIKDSSGYTLLFVIANEPAQPQPFDEIESLVANEYRRRAGDQILRDYMQRLRDQADVRVDEAFLDSLSDIE